MHEHGKSDSPIVPKKPSNKESGRPDSAEKVEERGLGKGKTFQQTRHRTPCREKPDKRDGATAARVEILRLCVTA